MVIPPIEHKPRASSLSLLSTQLVVYTNLSFCTLNCPLLTIFNGKTMVLHISLANTFCGFFFPQFKVILMLHYGKIPESFLPSSKGAAGTFILQISELILRAAPVLSIPRRCALKSRAMDTPMKNDAFKTASRCSTFESTLHNKENQL